MPGNLYITLLSIDIDRLRIISIDLTQEHLLHGAVTNLLGQPLRHAEVTLNTGSFVSVDVIIELIEKMLGMSDGEVIGIGVASPGVVDNGVVRSSTMRGWNNLDLSTPIAEHFGLEVNVSNDATAAMLTERFFGQGGPNMLFVRIERGIGSAILLSDTPVIANCTRLASSAIFPSILRAAVPLRQARLLGDDDFRNPH